MSTEVPSSVEEIEVALLLEAIFRHYGFDFREYAPASLKRRLWRRAYAEGARDDLGAPGARAARPGVHGAAAARPLDQRHGDVPRPVVLRARSARRSCRCSARIRSRASGSPAARPARRSTRWRSCSRRRSSTTARGSTRPTSTRRCSSARARGVFPLEKMQEYTQNYLQAGGTRAFSEYYLAQLRRRAVRPARSSTTSSSRSTTSSRTALQRVQRDPLPQRDDLLRPLAPGPRARALLREPRARSACSRSATRSRSGFTPLRGRATRSSTRSEKLYRKIGTRWRTS